MGVCQRIQLLSYWQQVVILSSASSQQKNHHDHADSGFRHCSSFEWFGNDGK
jgi:hypothetical protein